MARTTPPLAWLRTFECAARHLSFTAAARELNVTQSAVSQQVRSLEMRFAVSLFQRKPRGLALTDAGRRLLPDVSSALNTLAEATRAFEPRARGDEITIAASVSFTQWFIAPSLARFLATEPGLRVRIIGTRWPDEFRTSLADVEIRFGSAALVGQAARRLGPDALVAVAAPGFADGASDLGTLPLIESVGTTDDWTRWADQASYASGLEATVRVDTHGLAVDLACRGVGVALTSALVAGRALADGRLVQVHPVSLPAQDGYFLAVRPTAGEGARRLGAWIRDEVASIGAGTVAGLPAETEHRWEVGAS